VSKGAAPARPAINRQRDIDESCYSPQASLAARMRAVVVAQQRLRQREPVAELIADELPAPQ
jgi:hypothetical protein